MIIIIILVQAEDDSNTIILRLHETFGGCIEACLNTTLPLTAVEACDGLEQPYPPGQRPDISLTWTDRKVIFNLSPFQIVSLRCEIQYKC